MVLLFFMFLISCPIQNPSTPNGYKPHMNFNWVFWKFFIVSLEDKKSSIRSIQCFWGSARIRLRLIQQGDKEIVSWYSESYLYCLKWWCWSKQRLRVVFTKAQFVVFYLGNTLLLPGETMQLLNQIQYIYMLLYKILLS